MTSLIRNQKCCYMSTPAHVKSLFGSLVYIYKGKGELSLFENLLSYRDGKRTIEIQLDSIVKIEKGSYSRLAKPIRLDYLSITYQIDGSVDTTLFTPTNGWTTPVWKTNDCVSSWIESLNKAIQKTPATNAIPTPA